MNSGSAKSLADSLRVCRWQFKLGIGWRRIERFGKNPAEFQEWGQIVVINRRVECVLDAVITRDHDRVRRLHGR